MWTLDCVNLLQYIYIYIYIYINSVGITVNVCKRCKLLKLLHEHINKKFQL